MTQFPESARRRMQAWSADDHPDADLLTGFAEHALTASERDRVVAHLAACMSCREIVAAALPEFASPEVVAPKPHGWFQWPTLRWAALAATVVVVGAAVSTLVPRRAQRSAEFKPQLAQKTEPSYNDAAGQKAPAEKQATAQGRASEPKKKADTVATLHEERGVATPPPPPPPMSEVVADEAKPKEFDKLAAAPAATGTSALKDGFAYQKGPPAIVAGKVTDPSGAVVPNALVKITNADTKQSAAARTDSSGEYRIAGVKPGAYSVEATAPGMQVAKNELQVSRDVSQNLTLAPSAAAETVEVAAAKSGVAGGVSAGAPSQNVPQAAPAQTAPPAQVAQAEAMDALRAQGARQEAVGGAVAMRRMRTTAEPFRWRVGSKGAIERSADGKAWEAVTIDPGVTFRSLSSNEGDLWAGGTGGSLFHSADAGRTWSRLKVGAEGMWVAETITAVDFPSARTGFVTTASGAIWATQDGGRTWHRRQ